MNAAIEFSKRQQQVIELLLQGKSNRQIASKLGISESTVEFHLRNIYGKLHVNSRTEAILKLGQSTGVMQAELREPLVDPLTANDHNDGKFIQETKMKNRLLYYFLAGLLFGAVYWFYISGAAHFLNSVELSAKGYWEIWFYLSIQFLIEYGLWFIPATVPAVYEYRNSRRLGLSVLAVILTWMSANFGYFVSYIGVLALIGPPQMEDYFLFNEHTPAFWLNWWAWFRFTFIPDLIKGLFLCVIIGGVSGLVTAWLYSFWLKKTSIASPQRDNDGKFTQESKMKNRLLYYLLAGLLFGVVYWFYLSSTDHFLNAIELNSRGYRVMWISVLILFFIQYSVWLIPATIPAAYEYRNSRRLGLAALAVILTWMSSVFGYCTTWLVVLALSGSPQTNYYRVFNEHENMTAFWQSWMEVLRLTFLPDLIIGIFLSMIVGGASGLITTWLYSFWLKKTSLTS